MFSLPDINFYHNMGGQFTVCDQGEEITFDHEPYDGEENKKSDISEMKIKGELKMKFNQAKKSMSSFVDKIGIKLSDAGYEFSNFTITNKPKFWNNFEGLKDLNEKIRDKGFNMSEDWPRLESLLTSIWSTINKESLFFLFVVLLVTGFVTVGGIFTIDNINEIVNGPGKNESPEI